LSERNRRRFPDSDEPCRGTKICSNLAYALRVQAEDIARSSRSPGAAGPMNEWNPRLCPKTRGGGSILLGKKRKRQIVISSYVLSITANDDRENLCRFKDPTNNRLRANSRY